MKMFRYSKSMAKARRPDSVLLERESCSVLLVLAWTDTTTKGTIKDISKSAWLLLQSKHRSGDVPKYICQIRSDQTSW